MGTFTLTELAVLLRVCGQDEGVKENADAPDARAVREVSRESRRGSGRWDNSPGPNLASGHSSRSGKEKAGRSASSFTQGKADKGGGGRCPGVSGTSDPSGCCLREVELFTQSP